MGIAAWVQWVGRPMSTRIPLAIVGSSAPTRSRESRPTQKRRRERIAMKAFALRLAALALPIALFVAAAAPRVRY
jgi:hypothetical protein